MAGGQPLGRRRFPRRRALPPRVPGQPDLVNDPRLALAPETASSFAALHPGGCFQCARGLVLSIARLRRQGKVFPARESGASALISMKRFGLLAESVDAIVCSHLHGDHMGGIPCPRDERVERAAQEVHDKPRPSRQPHTGQHPLEPGMVPERSEEERPLDAMDGAFALVESPLQQLDGAVVIAEAGVDVGEVVAGEVS